MEGRGDISINEEKLKEIVEDVVFKSHTALAESVSNFFAKKQQTLIDRIIHYWPLILGTLFVVASFLRFGYADEVASKAISAVEAKSIVLEQSIAEINKNQTIFLSDLSQIRTDISWIKVRLMK